MKRILLIIALLSSTAFAQETARHSLYFYDASSRLEYICSASSVNQGTTTWTRAAATLTSIVDSGTTSTITWASPHGLTPGSTIAITGSSEDTDLNGTYALVTVATTSTATITTANVTDQSYTTATLAVAYTGPRDTAGIWSIQKLFYDSSGNLVKRAYAVGGTAPSLTRVAEDRVCASKATYTYR